ncbi:MAG: alpha-amylase [Firmicutes bacterium]|nr:alpha-amylase [Bacillota bacterium]
MAWNTPEWLKYAVIYEIYVPGHSQSGTFEGVTADLERIRDLGADIIWLMPIHPIGEEGRKGSLGSPYAIKDYRGINPLLGDETSLKVLIDRAHALGMKVIIDVVYNHTAKDSVLVKEHPDWFLRDSGGNLTRKVADWSDIYDLDYSNTALWDYQIETLDKWLTIGIDGFRCDVAALTRLEFWNKARTVLNRDREVIWLAESVHKGFVKYLRDRGYTAHSDPELHQAFDLTYDYDGFEYLENYFRGRGELKEYLKYLYLQETLYPKEAIKLRFLENHDQERIGAVISNQDILRNWVVFYCLLPGATLVWAGQEISTRKRTDFFEREILDWENGDYQFYGFFKNVLQVSKEIKKNCNRFGIEELKPGVVKINWQGLNEEYGAVLKLDWRDGAVDTDFAIDGEELMGTGIKRVKR